MENSTEVPVMMESSTTFSQVVFNDIPHTYPLSNPVTCLYTLTAPLQPNSRDWVGIFKVGWSTTKDYHTFVWVESTSGVVGQEPVRKKVAFWEYYLPKDDSEFYQFCYVDSNGQVRGASTPFCFKHPGEQSVDCSLENDLLVITTQDQVEQSAREKDVLMKELGQMREQNATMKSSLTEREQEVELLKRQSEQREKEKGDLIKELSEMMEQNESLKEQQQEIEHFKLSNEELVQKVSQLELQQQENAREQEKQSQILKSVDESAKGQESLIHIQEKYNGAVTKINQLKLEREELQGKVKVQSMEIAELRPSATEREQELCKLQDTIQLLQVDLQGSETERERICAKLDRIQGLAHDLDNTKRENQELRRSLSQQETLQNMPDVDMKEQHQILLGRLQDAERQLAREKQVSNDRQRHGEQAEKALREAMEQLENMVTSRDQTERKTGKLSLQLTEAYVIIDDKVGVIEEMKNVVTIEKQEKEQLSRENQNLKRNIERLREEIADLQAAPPAPMLPSSPRGSPDDFTLGQQEDIPPEYESLYTTTGSDPNPEEEVLMCRHCQEAFPGITQDELVLHEQCHRVCPFCTLIFDAVEQAVFEDHVYSHEL